VSDLHLPDGLEPIAKVIGTEATLRLADRCGGSQLYVPRDARKTHPWAQALDEELWKKFCAAFGGQRIDLPRGTFITLKKVAILELAAQGLGTRQIAQRVRCTERYVKRVRAMANEAERSPGKRPKRRRRRRGPSGEQLDLF